ncbi:hypothetical protein PG5_62080 [Pseudomonas sp. G5(2012)]|nr:hypothetical protein PG5_62080 [Pseudomonas sp. G5(2012)]
MAKKGRGGWQKPQRKKAADSSGFEDNFSMGRAVEKCRGKLER